MSDLISRQDVLDLITTSINQFGERYTSEQLNMWGLFTQMIQEVPSAQLERKKGHWVETQTCEHDGEIYCDQCESEAPTEGDYRQVKTNFCPNCGADMRGE